MTTILGLSGSLRAASLNSLLLRAAVRLAPAGLEVTVFPDLGLLPLFNVDLEARSPASVEALRARLIAADAVVVASPEYAHGVSGVLKNALDWMVGNESFVRKPVALFNASPRASHAQAALRETLRTMSAVIVEEACIAVPLLGARLDEGAIVADPAMAMLIAGALARLAERARTGAADGDAVAPVP